ncbi:hypothetical protein H4CHR_02948 [Variovorax sp. PBS-H4]|uniref:hypothetical protein n=1 Tax=Variovorax sp. PBS-H4 TaxID=434008 RepID=UPI0013170801|nr:hypothetical protein [Variovorax sp. PBS-H4]VTU32128.1 hypothetical protein H4CHR_02948 [Variovorax sp. PBS-H4]
MNAYQPLCSACRANSNNVFFKTCPGCQARRAAAMAAWQKKPGMPALPAPSVNRPEGTT